MILDQLQKDIDETIKTKEIKDMDAEPKYAEE